MQVLQIGNTPSELSISPVIAGSDSPEQDLLMCLFSPQETQLETNSSFGIPQIEILQRDLSI